MESRCHPVWMLIYTHFHLQATISDFQISDGLNINATDSVELLDLNNMGITVGIALLSSL